MKRPLALALPMLLIGCAKHFTPEAVSDPYGFFSGLWHGLVCFYAVMTNLLSWLLSLLGMDVLSSIEIVGRPNTGLWYYIGFVLGLVPYAGLKRGA